MTKLIKLSIIFLLLISCSTGSIGKFGKGVSITFDPRTVGMQIDDTIMQKSLIARLTLAEKNILYLIRTEG